MTPSQRAEELRQKATESRVLAARSTSEDTRAELLRLAAQFDRLADEIERRDAGQPADPSLGRRSD